MTNSNTYKKKIPHENLHRVVLHAVVLHADSHLFVTKSKKKKKKQSFISEITVLIIAKNSMLVKSNNNHAFLDLKIPCLAFIVCSFP